MSPRKGRPFEEKSKRGRLEIRTSDQEEKMLEVLVEKTGKTRTEILRQGLREVYYNLIGDELEEYGEGLDQELVLFANAVCPYCDANNRIEISDYEIGCESYDRGENSMGYELEHEVSCEEFKCLACGKEFSFAGSVWEYPVGVVNCTEIQSKRLEDE